MIKLALPFCLALALAEGGVARGGESAVPAIPLIEAMPARPETWRVLDWPQRAVDFDRIAFEAQPAATPWPLLTWAGEGRERFMISSYAGSSTRGEGICALAAVVSGSLVGIDKTRDRGRNWVALCDAWFSESDGVVLNNAGSKNNGGSFWYVVLPGVLYSQLALRYPDEAGLAEHQRRMADRYRGVVEALGGAHADFNHTGFDFVRNSPVDNGRWREPDAAAGIAYIEYAAWVRWHDPRHLEAARWCLDFLERRRPEEGNPLYETLLYYAPALAAKMNAEHGAHYDVPKLVDWCFTPNDLPGPARPYWGILARKFGEAEVYGLQGSTRPQGGYAFAMNTFHAAAALAPLARYDARYAAPLAKWLTHVANHARWFFADEVPPELQSGPQYRDTALKAVPYEGLRETGIAPLEWKLARLEAGSADPEAEARLHAAPRLEAAFHCDGAGLCRAVFEVPWPAHATGGTWQIEARVARAGAAFQISTSANADGPWQSCGGFTGPSPLPSVARPAGGRFTSEHARDTLWLKLEAVGRHEPGELLAIRSLRLSAKLSASPWASGDSFSYGHSPTDLAPYGGAYIGYFAALLRPTGHERVLAFDAAATDFLAADRTPCRLCYNAGTAPVTVRFPPDSASVTLAPGSGALVSDHAPTDP